MGWKAGISNGRPVGYGIDAVCDFPGCEKEIDRGLWYACAGMHGQQQYGCEKYFCEDHMSVAKKPTGEAFPLCFECMELYEMDDDGRILGLKENRS